MAKERQLPATYEVKDWVKSAKGRMITSYIDAKPIFEVKEGMPFTKDDFIRDLRRVSQRIGKARPSAESS